MFWYGKYSYLSKSRVTFQILSHNLTNNVLRGRS
jgi:hypothetical protein